MCFQRIKHNFYWKIHLHWICNRKAIKISPNQHAGLLNSFLHSIFWKYTKGLDLVSRPQFSQNFFNEKFFFVILHKLAKFHYQTVYFPSYSIKCVLWFTAWAFVTPYLNIWKIKIWLSQEQKELSKWSKKHFSLFQKFSLLDILTKLAKM